MEGLKRDLTEGNLSKTQNEYERKFHLLLKDFSYQKINSGDKQILIQKIDRIIITFKKILSSPENHPNYDFFKTFSESGSIIISSAGNFHPFTNSLKSSFSEDFDMILIGALNQDGLRSPYSEENKEVTIMAPSGMRDIYSRDNTGNLIRFGGTSAAAPLVTGALAGFEWLSGYHPKGREAKILLEKTAIPLLSSNDKPQKNGAGMLNAYKLAKVGERLREKCGGHQACFQREILNPKTYEFPENQNDDYEMEEAVGKAFPDCNQLCGGIVQNDCNQQREIFKKLRKASLLNPSNKKHWTRLACIYRKNGFTEAAEAALNTYKALLGANSTKEPSYKCEEDSDCVLIPPCEQYDTPPFLLKTRKEAEIHYAVNCSRSFCGNGSCGCENKVESGDKMYSTKCENSRCIMKIEKISLQETGSSLFPEKPSYEQPGSEIQTPARPKGSSGQR